MCLILHSLNAFSDSQEKRHLICWKCLQRLYLVSQQVGGPRGVVTLGEMAVMWTICGCYNYPHGSYVFYNMLYLCILRFSLMDKDNQCNAKTFYGNNILITMIHTIRWYIDQDNRSILIMWASRNRTGIIYFPVTLNTGITTQIYVANVQRGRHAWCCMWTYLLHMYVLECMSLGKEYVRNYGQCMGALGHVWNYLEGMAESIFEK